jgi:type IV pilus assembly protein PilY1
MSRNILFAFSIRSVCLVASALLALGSSAVTIPNTPLVTQISAKPMVMLVAGKDHKMFYEAYNDAGDVDGDGKVDVRFKPTIVYYGLFDSGLCYTHNDKGDNDGLFTPAAATTTGKCSSKWSGNWLNYMTTSRIDALRKVLYGGYREVDSTSETILRRAYIPHDAHSWGKEYTSMDVDGYLISDYTPLPQPNANTRHFFGNLTANRSTNCSTLNNCSDMPPLLRIRQNVGDDHRIWEWASKERPVLHDTLSTGAFPATAGAQEDRTVRVKVCTATYNTECKLYPNGQYKPIGLLHDYGENDAMLFGLLTGSYDKHMSGGRLRKVVSSFTDEVDSTTGQLLSTGKIVSSFNNLRVRGFNQSSTSSEYWKSNPYTDSAKAPTEGQLVDWGNPIGEMMMEAVRYFSGKAAATPEFAGSTTVDDAVGIKTVTWDDPYSASSSAKAPRCARANLLTISDIYPSFDSDQVPGSYFKKADGTAFTTDISLDTKTVGGTISVNEPASLTGSKFIGQSESASDSAPTAKAVTSIGLVRGLAPGEPGKQGSYSSASVSYFAKSTDLRSDLADPQNIDTFVVALASPLPEIKVPVSGGNFITLVPFSKTIGGSGVSATKGNYQPTNQIVDFYITTLANEIPNQTPSINGGRYQATFLINYEDVEQGGDHDMDAIARYEVTANANGTVSVTVTPTYQAGGMNQNMGYVISGTNADGVYLVAQDETYAQNYFLNVPAGQTPGYCDVTTPPAGCNQLPRIGSTIPTFAFTPSAVGSASFLPDPLRVAAKWGGFKDKNSNSKPDLPSEWDSDGNGIPDTYFFVQNPLKLKESLKRAFDSIFETNSSASNVLANSTSISNNTRVFQARFNANKWSGDLVAYPVTSTGVSTTPDWQAQDAMPAPASRQLFVRTTDDTTTTFAWSSLSTTDRALLDADPSIADNSQDVVEYLRGIRSKEIKSGGSFRDRVTLAAGLAPLGDIVHSSPFYEKDSDMLYVSANDGMLHAFRAAEIKDGSGTVLHKAGSEVFGFIPSEVLARLKNLASPGYNHEFLVDGDVVVSPKTAETGNKHLIFASLGRGGKGLFSLNVTTPTSFSASDFLWEYTPTGDSSAVDDGVLDTSTNAATDADLGFMLGRPVYAKLNNGKGAVIAGNGYNSTSGKAVLYIFLLNTSGQVIEVKKFDTLAAGDNGLATPSMFDADGNGTVDFIYAGDLQGNVWKFDVNSATVTDWAVGISGSPLFVAKDAANNLQPITSPIAIVKDEVAGDTHEGKRFVFFGTGAYFRTGDPADTAEQTWYGIIDENTTIANRSTLKARSFAVSSGTFGGNPVRAFNAAVTGDMVGKEGWYLDFTIPAGERMVTESVYFKLARPALVGSSIIPSAGDPCTPGGKGYINVISPFSGGAMPVGILDVNDNNNFTDDLISDFLIGSVDLGVGMPSRPTLIGNQLVVGGTEPTKPIASIRVNTGISALKGRISWREIVGD